MKTSVIKKAALSAALSVALAASVHGVIYQHSNMTVNADCNEAVSCKSSRSIKEDSESVSPTIVSFIGRAVSEDVDNIDFVYNELYTEDNEKYGYVVDFSYGSDSGFVIVSVADGEENIVEMDLDSCSPYSGKDGEYIYVSYDSYMIEHDDGSMIRLSANGAESDAAPTVPVPLNSDQKANIPASRDYSYCTGSLYEKEIGDFFYEYTTKLNGYHSNNCANAAGVIALNYWNKYFHNGILILEDDEMKDGNMKNGAAAKYMDLFYDYMRTNKIFGFGGTMPYDCYNGFRKLIRERGYKARQSVVTSFEDIKNQIDMNVPVFITSEDYYFTSKYYYGAPVPLPDVYATPGDHSFTIEYSRWYGILNSHTFVGYGYAEYTLHDKDGKESKIQLVKVADGWGGARYFNFNISDTTEWGMAAIIVSRC